jgi:hypothetical protein
MQKKPELIKKKYVFISTLLILLSQALFCQNKKDTGLIIFRSEAYFVKTKERNLASLFKTKVDTINAYSLGAPGDDAGNIRSFQDYLLTTIRLDTATYLTNLANNDDLYVEGWQKFYWTYGYIDYLERESRKVMMNYNYTTIINHGKRIVLKTINDTHLQYFTPLPISKEKKIKQKKRSKAK